LIEHEIRSKDAPIPTNSGNARVVGIFPESRLIEKRLGAPTLSVIVDRIARAGLDPKLFILDGDVPPRHNFPCVANIPRNFASLASAINSVDSVISADSLPAHLAEYFGRPVFVASPFPNEYWLPYGSFTKKRWGIFGNPMEFSASLDRFLCESRGFCNGASVGK
jgi:ADP-heptose:LPS heptosyltransferase